MAAIIAFIMAHQVMMASAAIGVLDLLIALAPGLESNGIFHMIYLLIKGVVTPKAIN